MNTEHSYLTAEWLTEALRSTDTIGADITVSSIETSTISGGMMANSYLIKLNYANGTGSEPASLVAKAPSSNPDSRKSGQEMDSYLKEVNFYKYIAPTLNMRVPECYYAQIDAKTSDFTLLLEDLNPATICLPKDCSLEKLKASTVELALLHAGTWNDEKLKDYDWMNDCASAGYSELIKPIITKGWEVLKASADDRVRSNFEQIGDGFLAVVDRWLGDMGKRFCLTHCDYRMTNVMYTEDNESIAIDWQTLQLGRPGLDTFYLIANTLDPEMRKAHETELLQVYYDTLLANGVEDYSLDDCIEDYEYGSLYAVMMVLATTYGIGATYLPDAYKRQIFFVVSRYWGFVEEQKIIERYL
ncbi:oxidoreductase family protein [Colwellia sp. 20A7]|uniref:oxidoreductase family protein n=1 Tax=Colwellia sp. 20A7 TaxID=2689569 RepID=UPI0013598AB5|nr:oxidoreductase family protein [Colwellia sp. 20A7]